MRTIVPFVSLALAVNVGCRKDPLYCADEPGNTCRTPDAPPTGCTANAECGAATPICDVLGSMTCVQCISGQTAACMGTTPVCGDDHSCRGCTAHTQCSSGACLPDGSCADEAMVAYVSAGGTGTACTHASPCPLLKNAIAIGKPFVKIAADGAAHDSGSVVIDGMAVTILAEPGAKLDRDGDGPILDVRSANADVTIYDLTISGATGVSGGDGITLTPNGGSPKLSLKRVTVEQNQGAGITATGGSLVVERSTIRLNAAGGLSLSAMSFDLTNNVIASNGGSGSTFGGLKIDNITGSGTRRLDFNTITANQAPATVNTGISCGTVLSPLTFSNNIIYGNLVAGGGKQLGGSAMCATSYSDIGPDATSGTDNINADPMFVNATQADFHLMSGSPCKDTADAAASLAIDIDGDTRPQGSRRDIGADEYKQ